MPNLNDGCVHTKQEILKNGIKKSAEEFAEGSDILKQTLLNLWDNGLDTRACCKGTIEKDHKTDTGLRFPYISLNVYEDNVQKNVDFIEYILAENSKEKPTIALKMYVDSRLGKTLVLNRFFFTNNGTRKMFETICSASQKMKKKELIPESNLIKNLKQIFQTVAKSEFLDAIEFEVKIKKDKAYLKVRDFGNKVHKYNITEYNMDSITDALDQFLYIPKYKKEAELDDIKFEIKGSNNNQATKSKKKALEQNKKQEETEIL